MYVSAGEQLGLILIIILRSLPCLFGNTFTMVEEKFEFYSSEMLQNEGFLLIVTYQGRPTPYARYPAVGVITRSSRSEKKQVFPQK